ncbi:MAG: TonB-dependent receptor [Acidobacteria bacterium]|nr:TonB-dependent receptor [Acidobacteriota bacterium]
MGFERRMHNLLVAGLVTVCVFFVSTVASAQVDTGGVVGVVTDDQGAALPGVTVTVTNTATAQSRTVVTDEVGRYRVTALQPSQYSVRAELAGFATVERPEIVVAVGSVVDVNLKMGLAGLQESITVTAAAPLIESTKAEFSTVIGQEVLQSIPSKSRNFLDMTLLTPGAVENTSTTAQGAGTNIGGSRAKEAAILVDGFYNQDEGFAQVKQQYSQDSIQEFQIVTFGGSAEYGRAIGGIVNAVTKSGGNRVAGSAYGYFRDDALNATNFAARSRGAAARSPFQRRQWGGSLGAPLIRDKTFFFGAFERTTEDEPFDNSITAANAAIIGLPSEDVGDIERYARINFVMGKVDHTLNDNNRIQLSYALSKWDRFNQSPQAFRTRSAAYGLKAPDHLAIAKWTSIAGNGSWLHEVKAAYFPRFYGVYGKNVGGPPLVPEGGTINPDQQDNASPPTVTITNAAIFGAATLNNKIDTQPAQIVYSSTKFMGRHSVKFGVDYMASHYDYNLFSQLNGNYSFPSMASFQAGAYNQYTQAFGDAHNPRWHHYLSGFIQDSWQTGNRLTINYGLRYDLELNPRHKASGLSFGNDYNNVSPRVAVSYGLNEARTTYLKVAAGMYYDRLFQNLSTFFTQLRGHEQLVSATWTRATPGAPVYPAVFSARPATLPGGVVNSWLLPDEVNVPNSRQAVVTIEHQLTGNIAVSGSFIYTKTLNREFVLDRNLVWDEATGAYVRPDSAYRQLSQYQFSGEAEYVGGIFEINKRGAKLGFSANLTVARAYESTANYGNMPNDQRAGIEADWGPQTDTPTVRGVISGWYNMPWGLQLSGVVRGRTGTAVNPVAAGLDLNGDGNLGDRTPTFGRNSFRMDGNSSTDVRGTWALPLGRSDWRATVYIEAFNLFDQENVRSVNNNYGPTPGSPLASWMQPQTWFTPREIQLGVRFSF